MLELEQKLAGGDAISTAAESAASAVAQQLELFQKSHIEQLENLKLSHQE